MIGSVVLMGFATCNSILPIYQHWSHGIESRVNALVTRSLVPETVLIASHSDAICWIHSPFESFERVEKQKHLKFDLHLFPAVVTSCIGSLGGKNTEKEYCWRLALIKENERQYAKLNVFPRLAYSTSATCSTPCLLLRDDLSII